MRQFLLVTDQRIAYGSWLEGDIMAHRYSVRPHLLDEEAIRKAIFNTGLKPEERGQIVDLLVENYTVDLDLLASTFATMGSLSEREAELPRAA